MSPGYPLRRVRLAHRAGRLAALLLRRRRSPWKARERAVRACADDRNRGRKRVQTGLGVDRLSIVLRNAERTPPPPGRPSVDARPVRGRRTADARRHAIRLLDIGVLPEAPVVVLNQRPAPRRARRDDLIGLPSTWLLRVSREGPIEVAASAPVSANGLCVERQRERVAVVEGGREASCVLGTRPTAPPRLYEGGRVVNGVGVVGRCSGAAGGLWVSSGAHLSIAPSSAGTWRNRSGSSGGACEPDRLSRRPG